MNKNLLTLFEKFDSNNIKYAILDNMNSEINILIPEKTLIASIMKSCGFKRIIKNKNDLFLYGMIPFQYYTDGKVDICVCNQVACRSTLNGEWVPLDRKINLNIFSNLRKRSDNLSILCSEDQLCYLLAKSVYTNSCFSIEDINRISVLLNEVDVEKLFPKLEGVFFKFTKQIFEMCKENKFNEIVQAVWSFADY